MRLSDSGFGGRAIKFLQLQKWGISVIAETAPNKAAVAQRGRRQ